MSVGKTRRVRLPGALTTSTRAWPDTMNKVFRPNRLAFALVLLLLTLYFWGNDQPEAAGLIPAPWDKLVHLAWYAVLSGLLLVATGRQAWPWVIAGMLLLAGWDEWHQLALPGRQPGLDDWAADALGIAAGTAISHAVGRHLWPGVRGGANADA